MYVLYESSLGYGLFDIEEFEEIGSAEATVQVLLLLFADASFVLAPPPRGRFHPT